jgi:hypothetical protein
VRTGSAWKSPGSKPTQRLEAIDDEIVQLRTMAGD